MRRRTVERSRVVYPALEVLLYVGAEHLVLRLDAHEESVVLRKGLVGAVLVTVHVVQDLRGTTKSAYKVAEITQEQRGSYTVQDCDVTGTMRM